LLAPITIPAFQVGKGAVRRPRQIHECAR
jgi:hypothetical protein